MFEELVLLKVRNIREFFAPDNEVLEYVYQRLNTNHETFKRSRVLRHIITNHRLDVAKKRYKYIPDKEIGNVKITSGDVIQSPTSPELRFISIEGLILDDIDYRILTKESVELFVSTAKGTEFENLPYDVFALLVETGQLQGQDLIGLCLSNTKIDQKCNHRDQEIFKRLLKKDFGVTYDEREQFTPRDRYVTLSRVVKRIDRATVLRVSIERCEAFHYEDRDEEHNREYMTRLFSRCMERKYPDFRLSLRRGDIIENVEESGYRSNGVYFYDGRGIINLDIDFNDYGSIPFVVFEEFAPDYWFVHSFGDDRQSDMNVDNRYVQGEPTFYWHMGDSTFRLNTQKIRTMIENEDDEIKFRGRIYYLYAHEGDDFRDAAANYGSYSSDFPDRVTVY